MVTGQGSGRTGVVSLTPCWARWSGALCRLEAVCSSMERWPCLDGAPCFRCVVMPKAGLAHQGHGGGGGPGLEFYSVSYGVLIQEVAQSWSPDSAPEPRHKPRQTHLWLERRGQVQCRSVQPACPESLLCVKLWKPPDQEDSSQSQAQHSLG